MNVSSDGSGQETDSGESPRKKFRLFTNQHKSKHKAFGRQVNSRTPRRRETRTNGTYKRPVWLEERKEKFSKLRPSAVLIPLRKHSATKNHVESKPSKAEAPRLRRSGAVIKEMQSPPSIVIQPKRSTSTVEIELIRSPVPSTVKERIDPDSSVETNAYISSSPEVPSQPKAIDLSKGKRSPLVSKSKPGATSCSMKSPDKPRSSAVRRSQRLTPMKSKPTARCVDSAVVSAKTSKPYVVVEKIRKSCSDNDSSSKLLDRPAGVLNNMRSSVVTSCVEKSAVSDRLSVFDDISSQGSCKSKPRTLELHQRIQIFREQQTKFQERLKNAERENGDCSTFPAVNLTAASSNLQPPRLPWMVGDYSFGQSFMEERRTRMTAPLYTEEINVREGMQEEERVRRMFNKRIREVTYLKGLDDEKEARREREVSLEASHRTRWGKEETVQEVLREGVEPQRNARDFLGCVEEQELLRKLAKGFDRGGKVDVEGEEVEVSLPGQHSIQERKIEEILEERGAVGTINSSQGKGEEELKGEAEAARQHGDQHINNMTKLRRWTADSNEEMDSLEYAKEENCQQQTQKKLNFPTMAKIAKFVYFGENHPHLYCSQSLSQGFYTTRYLVPKSQIVPFSIVGEQDASDTELSITSLQDLQNLHKSPDSQWDRELNASPSALMDNHPPGSFSFQNSNLPYHLQNRISSNQRAEPRGFGNSQSSLQTPNLRNPCRPPSALRYCSVIKATPNGPARPRESERSRPFGFSEHGSYFDRSGEGRTTERPPRRPDGSNPGRRTTAGNRVTVVTGPRGSMTSLTDGSRQSSRVYDSKGFNMNYWKSYYPPQHNKFDHLAVSKGGLCGAGHSNPPRQTSLGQLTVPGQRRTNLPLRQTGPVSSSNPRTPAATVLCPVPQTKHEVPSPLSKMPSDENSFTDNILQQTSARSSFTEQRAAPTDLSSLCQQLIPDAVDQHSVQKNKAGGVRHFPVTLETRNNIQHSSTRKQSTTSCQTDWSLRPEKSFMFVATSDVQPAAPGPKKRSRSRRLFRTDSETETDEEGEHNLSRENTTTTNIPEILRTNQQFCLDTHKLLINQTSGTMSADYTTLNPASEEDFIGENANDFFLSADDTNDNLGSGVQPPYHKLDMTLLSGADQIGFNADNLGEAFNDQTRALELSLDRIMNQDGGMEDSSDHQIDSIVNDIVVDLIYNKEDQLGSRSNNINFNGRDDGDVLDIFGDPDSGDRPYTPNSRHNFPDRFHGMNDEMLDVSREFFPNLDRVTDDGGGYRDGDRDEGSWCQIPADRSIHGSPFDSMSEVDVKKELFEFEPDDQDLIGNREAGPSFQNQTESEEPGELQLTLSDIKTVIE